MSDPMVEALARRILDLERTVSGLSRTRQVAHSTIAGAPVTDVLTDAMGTADAVSEHDDALAVIDQNTETELDNWLDEQEEIHTADDVAHDGHYVGIEALEFANQLDENITAMNLELKTALEQARESLEESGLARGEAAQAVEDAERAANAARKAISDALAAARLAQGAAPSWATVPPTASDADGKPVGAIWYVRNSNGQVAELWELTALGWLQRPFSETVIPQVAIGSGTYGSLSGARLVAQSVLADAIASNAVTAVKIAANAVTAVKLAANAVTAEKINAGAVATEKLAALAVTAEKLAAGSVIADKIAANAITAEKIAAGAITALSVAAGALSAANLEIGNMGDDLAPAIASGSIWNSGENFSQTVSYGIEAGSTTRHVEIASTTAPAVPSGFYGTVPAPASSGFGTVFRVYLEARFVAGRVPTDPILNFDVELIYASGEVVSHGTSSFQLQSNTSWGSMTATVPVRNADELTGVKVTLKARGKPWTFRVRNVEVRRSLTRTFLDSNLVSADRFNARRYVGTDLDLSGIAKIGNQVQTGSVVAQDWIASASYVRAATTLQSLDGIGIWDGVSGINPSFITVKRAEWIKLKDLAATFAADEVFEMSPSVGSGRIVIMRSGRSVEIVFEVYSSFGTSGHTQIATIPPRFCPPSLLSASSERRSGGAWFGTGTQYGNCALFTDGRLFVANTTGATRTEVNGSLPYFI